MKQLSLEEAHFFVAKKISEGSTSILPIFERLEQELSRAEKEREMLHRAKAIATSEKANF